MAAIALGFGWDPATGREGDREIYDRDRHVTCFGPNGSGKGVGLEMPNLLRLGDGGSGGAPLSIISIDSKGENRAVTGRWRKTVSNVIDLNPLNLFKLGSAGFNPLKLDPTSPNFFQHSSAIAEALIRIAEKGDPFFDISARNLVLVLIMWEVTTARAEGRMPLLKNVRGMLTGDLHTTAQEIFDHGDFAMASLAGQFREKNKTNDGIVATAASQTQWLLSQPMLDDLAKDGIDWSQLKKQATTVYVMLPAHALGTFSAWLRLVVACAFNALYEMEDGAGLRTLFMLSEFAQLGKLSMISAALAQGRGYGIQLFPVLQDINQLRDLYGRDAANTFLGMSGATFCFAPNEIESAEMISKRAGDETVPGLTVGDDPQGGEPRDTRRPERQRAWSPEDVINIPPFHGLVFYAGKSAATPVYAEPYWLTAELRGRYDPNPYHAGSSGGGRRRILRRVVRATAGATLAAAVLLGGAALLRSQGLLPGFAAPVLHHPVRR